MLSISGGFRVQIERPAALRCQARPSSKAWRHLCSDPPCVTAHARTQACTINIDDRGNVSPDGLTAEEHDTCAQGAAVASYDSTFTAGLLNPYPFNTV